MKENAKIMVASDIHGSLKYARKLLDLFEKQNCERLILTGDLYYHGPRNPLSDEYAPAEVARLFNSLKDRLTVIRGNCDSEVDEMISEFRFLPEYGEEIRGKLFIFTHGHKLNIQNPPVGKFDVLVYGHEHIGYIKRADGRIFVNCGSVSLPKNGSAHSCLIVDDSIKLVSLDGEVIDKADFSD